MHEHHGNLGRISLLTFKSLNRRRHNSDWLPLIFDTILFSLSKEISRDDEKKIEIYVLFKKRRPSLFRRLVGALRSGNSNSDDEEAEIDSPPVYLRPRRRSKTLTSLPSMM